MADSTIAGLPSAAPLLGDELLAISQVGVTKNVSVDELVSYVDPIILETDIIVKSASDLAGSLSSASRYVIQGNVDMGLQSIEVPVGGLTLVGSSYITSSLFSSADNYSMFTHDPLEGSGEVIFNNVTISVTGVNSEVWDIHSLDGSARLLINNIMFLNCTSLGTINSYLQGVETLTARLGGTPTLTLSGTWASGYTLNQSSVADLEPTMNTPLFAAGAAFQMLGRFRSNQIVELGSTTPLLDFSPINFPNPSSLQLQDMVVTRNGVADPEDLTITPNIDRSNLECRWSNNVGLRTTFEGGRVIMDIEAPTTFIDTVTYVDIAGTWIESDFQHFDSPANGEIRHIGATPIEYLASGRFTFTGTKSDEISIRLLKWDDSEGVFEQVDEVSAAIQGSQGGLDVISFAPSAPILLSLGDYAKVQVVNLTNNSNPVTLLAPSYFDVRVR